MPRAQFHLMRILTEAEHGQCRNHRRRTSARQADPCPPVSAIAVPRAGDIADALREAFALVSYDDGESPGQRGDVRSAAAAGELHLWMRALANIGRVKVAVAVHLGSTDEAKIGAALR